MNKLEGRVAFIAGGASRIGLGMDRAFLAESLMLRNLTAPGSPPACTQESVHMALDIGLRVPA